MMLLSRSRFNKGFWKPIQKEIDTQENDGHVAAMHAAGVLVQRKCLVRNLSARDPQNDYRITSIRIVV